MTHVILVHVICHSFPVSNLLKYIDNVAGSKSKTSRLLGSQHSRQRRSDSGRQRRRSSVSLRGIIRRTCSIHAENGDMQGEYLANFIDDLVHECSISSANALEILQWYTKPSLWIDILCSLLDYHKVRLKYGAWIGEENLKLIRN